VSAEDADSHEPEASPKVAGAGEGLPSVVVVGPGAVGSFLGGILAAAGRW
jgi:hypothetical protein